MVEVQNLTAGYGKTAVIHDISCTFRPGTITCILGPNGSGKSTLLKAILGLNQIQKGQVLLDGRNLRKNRSLAPRHMAYLPQVHGAPELTVGKTVLHGRFSHLRYPRHYTEKDLAICRRVMEQLDIIHLQDQFLKDLSGGQQQKVYLAMALAKEAKVYLFDEPNSFLDLRHQLALLEQMKDLRAQGNTLIAVFHDINFAMELSDQILLMDQGHLVAQAPPGDLLESSILENTLGIRCQKLVAEDGRCHYVVSSLA